jgi:hypothetical protein
VEPADDARRGGRADLVTAEHPHVRLSDMTLAPATRAQLERVLHEQRQRGLLQSHGFAPLRRLLFSGPPGTGKSTTAAALATELSLPLVTIGIEALISRYTGETAVKLRVIFDGLQDDAGGLGPGQRVHGRGQLDEGALQELLQPLPLSRAVADHLQAGAGKVPQGPDLRRGHERGPQQARLGQPGDPLGAGQQRSWGRRSLR